LSPPHARRRLLAAGLAALFAACSAEPDTPEARVRAVLAALEAGARERDAAAMKEHVSEGYGDPAGHDKRALAGIVTFHFLQNRSVHLLTRIADVAIEPGGDARATAFVAMAGVPIDGPEALVSLSASLYRFDLVLRDEDGDWRVVSAQWRPAAVSDFR
jgi:hypothetical protein